MALHNGAAQRKRSSYFDGVPEEVWNLHIGGYQVCHKWLYDRRGKKAMPGRTLIADDIAHYQRIVVALKEAIRLMEEIDEVIEAHSGSVTRKAAARLTPQQEEQTNAER